MTIYSMLVGLIALLLGLAIGKAWERYKLRDGQWIDRRKARESPHFIVGLDLVVSHQIDLAIEELSQVAWLDEDALEIQLVLGNLYREKGQVGRAIHIHQRLLQRPRLKTLEHAYILLCLGLDFRRGGFVDRAYEAFKEVLRLDPKNRHALVQLEKLHEEQHQWAEAYEVRRQLADVDGEPSAPRDQAILAFLENELGEEALRQGDADAGRGAIPGRDRSRQERDTGVPQSGRHPGARRRLGLLRCKRGSGSSRSRRSARISPSIGCRRPVSGSARRSGSWRPAVAWWPATRRTGGPGSPWPGIAPRSATCQAASNCSSRRSATTRTRW